MKPFFQKLRHGAPLSTEDEALLLGPGVNSRHTDKGRDIAKAGDILRGVPLILNGWACRYHLLANGKRQILALYLPGDLCEPFGASQGFADYPLGAITSVVYASISREALLDAVSVSTVCRQALWWDLLIATNIERELIVRLGQRSAAERLGHLFCELELRLEMAGFPTDTGYDMPLTQTDLGDLLGLTPVHVNRSLQDMRAAGLISLKSRRLSIRRPEELRELSEFDASYLHTYDPIGEFGGRGSSGMQRRPW